MTSQPFLLFVFGLGYTAQQLGRQLLAAGGRVAGTVRSEAKAAELRSEGFEASVWTGQGQPAIPDGAHWLVTLPPDREGCPAARSVRDCPDLSRSVTYLSTTGVYGDLKGGWATEWSPPRPASARAEARVRAEDQWRDLAGDGLRIVRLPGIYGPGRSPFDRLRDGTARRIVKEGQVFSRVHVDDIASGLEALLLRPEAAGVFHLCDDLPAPPQDVIL
ncbi:MAG: SDR family NAD(P)-dependent oxidoreductase, partial [Hyphomonas sp.]